MSESMRECYERTGNPVYVWRALASASVDKRALPDWIAEYLRQAAVAMCRAQGTPEQRAAAVLGTLGLVVGNRNAFHEWDKDNDAAWAALDSAYFGGGDSAADILARERGSVRTARDLDAGMQKVRRQVKRTKANRRFID